MTSLGWQPGFKCLERLGALLPPGGEVGVHAGDEGGELRVPVDGGLDGRLFHGEIDVAGTVRLEQRLPELRADVPVVLEGVDIGVGNAAAQVAFDVLKVLGLLAVDVARQVEVEVVLLDLLDARPCASISGLRAAC